MSEIDIKPGRSSEDDDRRYNFDESSIAIFLERLASADVHISEYMEEFFQIAFAIFKGKDALTESDLVRMLEFHFLFHLENNGHLIVHLGYELNSLFKGIGGDRDSLNMDNQFSEMMTYIVRWMVQGMD